MAKVIERVEACYEVRGVDPVYGAHPESVVAECDRGERPALNASRTNRVQRRVDNELSRMVLGGSLNPGDKVVVDAEEDRLTFNVLQGTARSVAGEAE